ncbi:hypothetical protein HDU93_001474 [Gonapodya sp. JEL0774]|nr:hypothetical protein HDU93_001474 [Gonapodya sp. JEL0774]
MSSSVFANYMQSYPKGSVFLSQPTLIPVEAPTPILAQEMDLTLYDPNGTFVGTTSAIFGIPVFTTILDDLKASSTANSVYYIITTTGNVLAVSGLNNDTQSKLVKLVAPGQWEIKSIFDFSYEEYPLLNQSAVTVYEYAGKNLSSPFQDNLWQVGDNLFQVKSKTVWNYKYIIISGAPVSDYIGDTVNLSQKLRNDGTRVGTILIISAIAVVLFMSGLSLVFTWFFVTSPIRVILAAMDKATRCDFSSIKDGSFNARPSAVSEVHDMQARFVGMLKVFAMAVKTTLSGASIAPKTSTPSSTSHTPLFRKVVVAREEEAGVQQSVSKRRRKRKNKDGTGGNIPLELTVVDMGAGPPRDGETAEGTPDPDVVDGDLDGEGAEGVDGGNIEGREWADGEGEAHGENTQGIEDNIVVEDQGQEETIEAFIKEELERGKIEGRYVTAEEVVEALVTRRNMPPTSALLDTPTLRSLRTFDQRFEAALWRTLRDSDVVTAYDFLQQTAFQQAPSNLSNGPLSGHPSLRAHFRMTPDAPIPPISVNQARDALSRYLATFHDARGVVLEDEPSEDGFLAHTARELGVPGPAFVGIAVSEWALRPSNVTRRRGIEAPINTESAGPCRSLWESWNAERGGFDSTWTILVEGIVREAGERGLGGWEGQGSKINLPPLTDSAITSSREAPVEEKEVEIKSEPGLEGISQVSLVAAPPTQFMSGDGGGKWRHGHLSRDAGGVKFWMLESMLERAQKRMESMVSGGGAWLMESYNALPTTCIKFVLSHLSARRPPPSHPSTRSLVVLVAAFLRAWSDPLRRQAVSELVVARIRPPDAYMRWIETAAEALKRARTEEEEREAVAAGEAWGLEEVRRVHMGVVMCAVACMCGVPMDGSVKGGEGPLTTNRPSIPSVVRFVRNVIEHSKDRGSLPSLSQLEKKVLIEFGISTFEGVGIEGCVSFGTFLERYMGIQLLIGDLQPSSRNVRGISAVQLSETREMGDLKSFETPLVEIGVSPNQVPSVTTYTKELSIADLVAMSEQLDPLSILRRIAFSGVTVPRWLDPVLLHVTRPELDLMEFMWQCMHYGGFLDENGDLKVDRQDVARTVVGDACRMQYEVNGPEAFGLGGDISWLDVALVAIEWRKQTQGIGMRSSDPRLYEAALFCSAELRHLLNVSRFQRKGEDNADEGYKDLVGSFSSLRRTLPAVGNISKFHAALMARDSSVAAREAAALFIQQHSGAGEKIGQGDLQAMLMAARDIVGKLGEAVARTVLTGVLSELPAWMKEEFADTVLNKSVAKLRRKVVSEVDRRNTMLASTTEATQLRIGSYSHRIEESRVPLTSLSLESNEQYRSELEAVGTLSDSDHPRWVIEDIRKSEFGIGVVNASPEVELVLKNQRDRVERALKRLGSELYTSDSHFALELIQNADDNQYEDLEGNEIPGIQFILTPTAIVIRNNEDGFSAADMRSLCDVGRSTKEGFSESFIGRKGVGFKSVFRVTSNPEIHSNGFHIRFDDKSFVIPEWIDYDSLPLQDDPMWNTKIVLPLTHSLTDSDTLLDRILDARLLIFLRNVKRVQFVDLSDPSNPSRRTIERVPSSSPDFVAVASMGIDGSISLSQWLVVRKSIDIPSWCRRETDSDCPPSGELALAFPLTPPNDPQPAFAYLPLRTYGLKFIVQGDFAVPSSREDIDSDHPRNVFLRNEIPRLFVEAFKRWIAQPQAVQLDQPVESFLQMFLEYIPDFAEGFMRPVVSAIQTVMKTTDCLLTSEGLWVTPSHALQAPPDHLTLGLDVSSLIPGNLLWEITGKRWLSHGLGASDALCRLLGIETLSVDHLTKIMGSELVEPNAQLFTLLAKIVEARGRGKHARSDLERVRNARLFVLSDGSRVNLSEEKIFFPEDIKGIGMKSYEFMEDMKLLDTRLFPSTDAHRSSVIWLFEQVGVKHRDPHDVIYHYIIPRCRANMIEPGPKLLSCSRYLRDHTSTCDECASKSTLFEDLGQLLQVPTTSGWRHVRGDRRVYLPIALGGVLEITDGAVIDVTILEADKFVGDQETLVDDWRRFFRRLGCFDWFTPTKDSRVYLKIEEMPVILENRSNGLAALGEGPWTVEDYVCTDLTVALQRLSNFIGLPKDQMKAVLSRGSKMVHVFDQRWTGTYSFYKHGLIRNSRGDIVEGAWFPSTFVTSMRDNRWIPSREKFARPADLFLPTKQTQSMVGDLVEYSPEMEDVDFVSTIGLRESLEVHDVSHILEHSLPEYIQRVSSADEDSELQRKNIELLQFLVARVTDEQERKTWSSKHIVFLPRRKPYTLPLDSSRNLKRPKDLIWVDPALVGEYAAFNFGDNIVESFYRRHGHAKEVLSALGVQESPSVEAYLATLERVAAGEDSFRQRLSTARRIFETLTGQLLLKRNQCNSHMLAGTVWKSAETADIPGGPGGLNAEAAKGLLLSLAVFPSHQGKWVGLSAGEVLINDDPYIAEQFDEPGVHFLFSFRESNGNLSATPTTVRRLLEALGVLRLSQVVVAVPNSGDTVFSDKWDHRLIHVVPFLQRYLYTFRKDAYIADGQRFQRLLATIPVMVSSNFRVHYKLKDHTSPLVPASCAITNLDSPDTALYIDELSLNELGDVFLELTRIFDSAHHPDPDLARFLTLISSMGLNGVSLFCQNEGIDELPETDPLWNRIPKHSGSGSALMEPEEDLIMLPSVYGGQRPRKAKEASQSVVVVEQSNGAVEPQNTIAGKSKRKAESDAIDVDSEASGASPPLALRAPVGSDRYLPNPTCSTVSTTFSTLPFNKRPRFTHPSSSLGYTPSSAPGFEARQLDSRERKLVGPITNTTVGRLGEKLVAEKLRKQYARDGNVQVVWLNEEEESGERWDIEIVSEDADGHETIQYIEVKTTRGADKSWFEISHREFFWALEKGASFTLVRVFLNIENQEGDTADFEPVFLTVDNFGQKFRDGKVKLRAEI